jgi:hypothetical protein
MIQRLYDTKTHLLVHGTTNYNQLINLRIAAAWYKAIKICPEKASHAQVLTDGNDKYKVKKPVQ